ncbi:Asparagine synthetase A [Paracholeplasma brassicae]|uniref:Aspartate--ammonia ligase n=1 Tax=Acholeplasma brassicae TaxID=61635 RepID=U4KTF6_9MOLU|nr:aspartate--ammonia ligase [Paracholeplasma brassicae]CCV66604.1 Asparagine synthetase A [Paracholeplasma brassicae]
MYQSKLSLMQTEDAIKAIKDLFEKELSKALKLKRISSPLIVDKDSGINDYLNGAEPPVGFSFQEQTLEIVQSLAKWKRMALNRYGFSYDEGLYTDMNALRPNEVLSPIHSIYVDQWDWEKIISKEERQEAFLISVVKRIYEALKQVEDEINKRYAKLTKKLPESIYFISSEALLMRYPTQTPKEREYLITKEKGAVFITQIGGLLSNNEAHDGRSPDYDDWSLNGDLLVYHEPLDIALELSSMGIRVDDQALLSQLELRGNLERLNYPYHQAIINKTLPLTIGGGIGQSRLCLFYLEKRHIGEVQASHWPEEMKENLAKENVYLL